MLSNAGFSGSRGIGVVDPLKKRIVMKVKKKTGTPKNLRKWNRAGLKMCEAPGTFSRCFAT